MPIGSIWALRHRFDQQRKRSISRFFFGKDGLRSGYPAKTNVFRGISRMNIKDPWVVPAHHPVTDPEVIPARHIRSGCPQRVCSTRVIRAIS